MKHLKPLNQRAQRLSDETDRPDVYGYACSICCNTFAPGWEIGETGNADPCPWMNDLSLCWSTCYWTGQVPDQGEYPEWLNDCPALAQDWVRLCVVPD